MSYSTQFYDDCYSGCCDGGGCDGAIGPTGPQGPIGPTGPAGGGGGSGGSIYSGITAASSILGPTGTIASNNPVQISHIHFDTESGFSMIQLPGLNVSGGDISGVLVSNIVIQEIQSYLFNQPPAVNIQPANTSSQTEIILPWTQYTPTTTQSAIHIADHTLHTTSKYFNWFPYIDHFIFQYRTTQPTASSPWPSSAVTISSNNQGITVNNWINYVNSTLRPNSLKEIKFQTGVGTTQNLFATNHNLTVIIPTATAVGNNYWFRFAFINQSADEPNWVEWGGTTGLTFGNAGPALAPASINLNSNAYNTLNVNGQGNGLGKDASLNTTYSQSWLKIGYGAEISGNRVSNIQVNGLNASKNITTAYGFDSVNNPTFSTGPPWPPTGSLSLNTHAHPEYQYDVSISSYYAINSSVDFSNTKVYSAATDTQFVPIPNRTAVTGGVGHPYNYFIDSAAAFNFNTTLDGSPALVNTEIGWRRGTNTQYSCFFINDASLITFTNNSLYSLAANYGDVAAAIPTVATGPWVVNHSMLGIDSSGNEVTKLNFYVAKGSVANINADISSVWKIGFTGQDVAEDVSNNISRFTVSLLKEVQNVADIARTKGYYLGVDVSNISVTDISLLSVPDICNNGYAAYELELEQLIRLGNGAINTYSNIWDFNLAKRPDTDVFTSNKVVTVTNLPNVATTTTYFYGIHLPDVFDVTINFDINNLNPDWAPGPTTEQLYNIKAYVNPSALTPYAKEDLNDNKIGYWGANTSQSLNITEVFEIGNNSTTPDYDYSVVPYSRYMPAGQQFSFEVNYISNNLFRSATVGTFNFSNDISFNQKALWWDFTWGHTPTNNWTSSPTTPSITFPSSTGLTVSKIELMEVQNPFDCSYVTPKPSLYQHSQNITFNQAMWAKEAWFGSSYTDVSLNPYIDYSATGVFYGPPGSDYSIYDASGNNKTVNYDIANYYDNTVSVTKTYVNLKWILLKLTCSASTHNLSISIDNLAGTTLTLGTDYVLFYREEQQTANSNVYQWIPATIANLRDTTPWLDCANQSFNVNMNTFNQGQAAAAQRGLNNGNYKSGAGINNRISVRNTSNPTFRHLAIGIPQSGNIETITIGSGTN